MGNLRSLIFLTLALFAGIFLLLTPSCSNFSLLRSEENFPLFRQPLSDIDHIVFSGKTGRIGLIKQNGHWLMTAPFAAEVDQSAVLRFLDTLEALRVRDITDEDELAGRKLSLASLKLSPPRETVFLEGQGRREEIYIGRATPSGEERYVRKSDEKRVLVVSAFPDDALPKDANSFRSRKLIPCATKAIRSLSIRSPGNPYLKLTKNDGKWQFEQPASAPADETKIEPLLRSLETNSVASFIWPSPDDLMDAIQSESVFKTRLALFGLDERGTELQLGMEGENTPVKLVFGIPSENSPELSYARIGANDSIGLVPSSIAEAFSLTPIDLRNRRLFSQSPELVKRIQVELDGVAFALAQTNRRWRLEAPSVAPADQNTASAFVESLLSMQTDENLRVKQSSEDLRERERQFLPVSATTVEFANGKRSFTIAPDDIENKIWRVAFDDTSARFFVAASNVPPALLSMSGLLNLHDRTMLSVAPASIRKLTFKQGGKSVALNRDAPGLEQLLPLLAKLKADRIEKLDLSLQDLDTYGLREPFFELDIDVASADAVRKTIIAGRSPGFGNRYAMIRGSDILFVLDEDTINKLSKPFQSN